MGQKSRLREVSDLESTGRFALRLGGRFERGLRRRQGGDSTHAGRGIFVGQRVFEFRTGAGHSIFTLTKNKSRRRRFAVKFNNVAAGCCLIFSGDECVGMDVAAPQYGARTSSKRHRAGATWGANCEAFGRLRRGDRKWQSQPR